MGREECEHFQRRLTPHSCLSCAYSELSVYRDSVAEGTAASCNLSHHIQNVFTMFEHSHLKGLREHWNCLPSDSSSIQISSQQFNVFEVRLKNRVCELTTHGSTSTTPGQLLPLFIYIRLAEGYHVTEGFARKHPKDKEG